MSSKTLFVFSIIFFCSRIFAAAEVVMFIDTNNNDKEIATARKTAEKLGKKFIVYPPEGQKFIRDEFKEFVQDNDFSTMIISGHNGGGRIRGGNNHGFVSYTDFDKIFKDDPEKKKALKTLMLLGCNTSNYDQILKWKSRFPNLSIIAGYDGTAPAQDKLGAHSYIEEILTKKDELLEQVDKKKLEIMLTKLKNIYALEAGIYLSTHTCVEGQYMGKEYFFSPHLKEKEKRFREFDFEECFNVVKEYLNKKLPLYREYYEGELLTESNENRDEVRELYNYFHRYKHCLNNDFAMENGETLYVPHWKQVLFLRFWKETQENIAKYYQSPLKRMDLFWNQLENDEKYIEKKINMKKERLEKELADYQAVQNVTKEDLLMKMNGTLTQIDFKISQITNRMSESYRSENKVLDKLYNKMSKIEGGQEKYYEIRDYIMNLTDFSVDIDKFIREKKLEAFDLDIYDLFQVSRNKNYLQREREFYIAIDENIRKKIPVVETMSSAQVSEQFKIKIAKIKSDMNDLEHFDIKQFQAELKKEKIFRNYEDFKEASRKEVMEIASTLGGYYEGATSGVGKKIDQILGKPGRKLLNRYLDFYKQTSETLNPNFIPFAWHEEQEVVEIINFDEEDNWVDAHKLADVEESLRFESTVEDSSISTFNNLYLGVFK